MPPRRRPSRRSDPSDADQLEFSLEGRTEDRGLVRARAFVAFLEDTLEALGQLEKTSAPGKSAIDYRIVELGISSAKVALEPIAPAADPKRASALKQSFVTAVKAAQAGKLEKAIPDPQARAAFERVVHPRPASGIRSVSIRVDGERFRFVPPEKPELRLYPPAQTSAVGSFAGFLDAVNVHADPIFYLYPAVGPQRIPCVFDRHTMFEDVRAALRRYAIVHGLLEYVAGEPFPQRIVVERIESFPTSPKPSIRELVGLAPELAHGRSAEEHIRAVRDAAL